MHYLIGDLQGCCDAFDRLLAQIGFSPSRDKLHVLGDLVNRGPQSLRTLQRMSALGASAVGLLGNHDLHLLAVAAGVRPAHRSDTLAEILAHPEREALLDWLRHCPLADQAQGWLLVHAGVPPQWDADDTLAHAQEVQAVLRSPELGRFLPLMYGNQPDRWSPALAGPDRWRFIVNALTRMRFCDAQGRIDLKLKDGLDQATGELMAWFDVPGRRTAGQPVAFGHWSTLGLRVTPDLLAIDTGCVWGGALTAVRVDGGRREVLQVACDRRAAPG